jgi:uncharacterized protein YjaG (DUF416 family)
VVKFDRHLLKDQLERMSPRCRMLFALVVAERLFPLYVLYNEKTARGRPNYLRSTLDHLWELALRGQAGHKEPVLNDYESLIPAGDLVPRSEVDSHPLSGLAEFAILALASACQCQLTGDSESAVCAAESGGYAAVDNIANSLEGMDYGSPEAEVAILKKDYVQAEILRQRRDVTELENVARDGSGIERLVESFRGRAKSEGVTLIPVVSSLCE